MYLMYLINSHSAPLTPTVPSMPTIQACYTSFNKGTNYVANNAFAMATKPDLAMYYHRAAFSPVLSTFISAIDKGNFSTWPGLTTELISKHLPNSLATAKGYNKLARQNVRSTRPQELPVARTKTVQITVVYPSDLLATDLTGQQATKAPINPPMEPQEIAPLSQQIQQSTSVDLSPTLQELPGSNRDGHRCPTRFSLKKNSY